MTAQNSYMKLILVWLSLMVLTALMVTFSGMALGNLAVALAVIIGGLESYLIIRMFMKIQNTQFAYKLFMFLGGLVLVVTTLMLFTNFTLL